MRGALWYKRLGTPSQGESCGDVSLLEKLRVPWCRSIRATVAQGEAGQLWDRYPECCEPSSQSPRAHVQVSEGRLISSQDSNGRLGWGERLAQTHSQRPGEEWLPRAVAEGDAHSHSGTRLLRGEGACPVSSRFPRAGEAAGGAGGLHAEQALCKTRPETELRGSVSSWR